MAHTVEPSRVVLKMVAEMMVEAGASEVVVVDVAAGVDVDDEQSKAESQ